MFAAVLNFWQLLMVVVLSVCACTYAKDVWPGFAPKGSLRWKLARNVRYECAAVSLDSDPRLIFPKICFWLKKLISY